MKKLILPLLSLLAIGAAAPALSAADRDDCYAPTYTVTRTWVEGRWEPVGCNREQWVPGHWVETRHEVPPQRVVIVHDRDRGWRDDRHDDWRDRHESERHEVVEHRTTVVAPVPVPLPLPIPFPWFGHRH